MKLVIVTGSRDWTDRDSIRTAIRDGLSLALADVVMHGDAPGADTIAGRVARELECTVLPMPAQWDRDGKAAGPQRNQRMVDVATAMQACGWTVEVHAFPLPGSRGTYDMVRRCERAGFAVTVHEANGGTR